MEWKWSGSGVEVGWKWSRSGVEVEWKWSGSGVEVELDDNWVSGGAPVFKLEVL